MNEINNLMNRFDHQEMEILVKIDNRKKESYRINNKFLLLTLWGEEISVDMQSMINMETSDFIRKKIKLIFLGKKNLFSVKSFVNLQNDNFYRLKVRKLIYTMDDILDLNKELKNEDEENIYFVEAANILTSYEIIPHEKNEIIQKLEFKDNKTYIYAQHSKFGKFVLEKIEDEYGIGFKVITGFEIPIEFSEIVFMDFEYDKFANMLDKFEIFCNCFDKIIEDSSKILHKKLIEQYGNEEYYPPIVQESKIKEQLLEKEYHRINIFNNSYDITMLVIQPWEEETDGCIYSWYINLEKNYISFDE